MRRSSITRTRIFSFAVPACMDGMLNLAQVSLPLVAIRFGASPWFLGMLGWTSQSVRLPCNIGSGLLSDRIGRIRVIIPAAVLAIFACLGFAVARDNGQLLLFYILISASIGLFYPALQAFIGDHSPRGELRKNLSWFNAGWTIGGTACGLISGYLLAVRQALPFTIAAVVALAVVILVWLWSRSPAIRAGRRVDEAASAADDGPGPLLIIARIGHFMGFFGYAMARLQFPKLGVEMNMTEGTIGLLVGIMLVGQAVGIFASNAGPWWRGKLWPQILAQVMMAVSGLMVFVVRSPVLFALAFLVQGTGLGIAYTGALYYGLQARTKMGKSTGIHESLVTSGNFSGSLVGGAVAQFVSLRAPYATYAVLSSLAVIASLAYWKSARREMR
jgi:MFS family permease